MCTRRCPRRPPPGPAPPRWQARPGLRPAPQWARCQAVPRRGRWLSAARVAPATHRGPSGPSESEAFWGLAAGLGLGTMTVLHLHARVKFKLDSDSESAPAAHNRDSDSCMCKSPSQCNWSNLHALLNTKISLRNKY